MLHIGHQREELNIELEGKKLIQEKFCVYRGGGRREDGERYVEEHRPERTCEEQLKG